MMRNLSFLDKLKVLVDVSSSSGLSIVALIILLFLVIINVTTNKKNKKITKRLYITMYIAVTLVLLLQYGKYITKMFDYMMNNFFIAVYFPNLAIYLAAIITTNIILWRTIFTRRVDKVLKVVNSIVYSFMHYLLILILNIISKNSLNVFDNASVYGNSKALALISISSTVFVLWIVFLIIYKIIRKTEYKEIKTNNIKLPKNIVEVVKPKRVKEVPKKVLPSNIVERNYPKTIGINVNNKLPKNITVAAVPREIREVVKKVLPSNIVEKNYPKTITTHNKIPSNIVERAVPKQVKEVVNIIDVVTENKEKDLLEQYENMLTLNDYKKVLEILKHDKEETLSAKIEPIIESKEQEEQQEPVYVQPVLDRLLNLKSV